MRFFATQTAVLALMTGAFQYIGAAAQSYDDDYSLFARDAFETDDDYSGLSVRELAHELVTDNFVLVHKRDLALTKRDTCACGSTSFSLKPGGSSITCNKCGRKMQVTVPKRDKWGRPI